MLSKRRMVLGFILLLTGVSVVLPPSQSGFSADIADVLRVGQMPFARMGVLLDDWLRPSAFDLGGAQDREQFDHMQRERDTWQRLFRQERIRADALAQRVRLLESLPDTALRAPVPPVTLSRVVTGRSVGDATARIELQPPDESQGRVQTGDVVIARDRLLVGRLEQVGSLRLLVRPVAHPDSGPVEVAVVRTVAELDRPLDRLLLQPDGTGLLHADVDLRVDIEVGDQLMLTDPGWPSRVQGLVLAVVKSLEPIDEAPLRRRVVAAPAAPPQAVVQVAIVSAQQEGKAP